MEWNGRRILVGVCGGIAAYKACELVSSLSQSGAEIKVIMTHSAQAFVTPLSLATLSRQPAHTDTQFWHDQQGRPLHIELAEWAEALVILPLTANTLAKITLGLADNLLTNVVLAMPRPILLAAAMNTQMWNYPAVQQHWQTIQQRHWTLAPESGRLACDTVGTGRLAAISVIEETLAALLWTKGTQDWQGRRVLVTGGATREFWDAVRFLSNPATGRMGAAMANAAAARGAVVIYIYGGACPTALHPGVTGIPITSAADLTTQVLTYALTVDTILMTAAVSDVRPEHHYAEKVPKQALGDHLALATVPDILGQLATQKPPGQRLIGWAAQSGDPVAPARQKLLDKNLDAIVANPIDQLERGFGSVTNEAIWITPEQEMALPFMSKVEMAHRILDLVASLPPR